MARCALIPPNLEPLSGYVPNRNAVEVAEEGGNTGRSTRTCTYEQDGRPGLATSLPPPQSGQLSFSIYGFQRTPWMTVRRWTRGQGHPHTHISHRDIYHAWTGWQGGSRNSDPP